MKTVILIAEWKYLGLKPKLKSESNQYPKSKMMKKVSFKAIIIFA